MEIQNLLIDLKNLGLPDDQYAIYGSGPMAIRGITEVNDIDIVVKDKLFGVLKQKYQEFEPGKLRAFSIDILSARFAIVENPEAIIDRAETIQGLRFIRLDDLIQWKKKLGREKDLNHVKMIEEYLKTHNE